MPNFQVMVSSVWRTSTVTRSAADELATELGRLRREADELLTAQWRGSAATAFDRSWTAWDVGAREVIVALERLTELLATAGHEYAARDELSASSLRLTMS